MAQECGASAAGDGGEMKWKRPTIYVSPDRVESNSGVVYSTDPLVVIAGDSTRYYLKDKDSAYVQAEMLALALADLVGLEVSSGGVTRIPNSDVEWFASEEVEIRSGIDMLIKIGAARNVSVLADCIAFDVWVANDDRNMGGVVARAASTGANAEVDLVLIDFESASVLRGTSGIVVSTIPLTKYWPRNQLGQLCKGQLFPEAMVRRISALSKSEIQRVVDDVKTELGRPLLGEEWIVPQLVSRAASIRRLCTDLWKEAHGAKSG